MAREPNAPTGVLTGMFYKLPSSREEAVKFDRHDILAHAREAFDVEGGLIYLVGHSLGPATHNALDALQQAAKYDWRRGLVRSWNTAGWFTLAKKAGTQLARLTGARRQEVMVADSVSANLFKLASAALSAGLPATSTLIIEDDEFPTDQYITEALANLQGADFRRVPAGEGLATLSETGGILIRSLVSYRNGERRDMAQEEKRAKESGGVIIWDLSHATGVIEIALNKAGARLATGCTYKYLNGGPGAPSFLYVQKDLIKKLQTPMPGWMGHAHPFTFDAEYTPADDITRFANGTPPILSLAALSGALEAFEALDISLVAAKARALGDLATHRAQELGLTVCSPLQADLRGGHVSFTHPNAHEIVRALGARNILADFRAPDTIRFGLSPLFLRFTDIWDAMDALADILETQSWDKEEYRERAAVT